MSEKEKIVTKKNKKPKIEEKPIRLVWGSDENTPVVFANQLIVSHASETEFHLVFGHLSPPLTIGLEEHELPEVVKIKPVSTIVVSVNAMKAFVKAINDNMEKFETKQESDNDDN